MNWNILQTLYSEHTTLQKCANHLSYVIRKDCVIQDIKKKQVLIFLLLFLHVYNAFTVHV